MGISNWLVLAWWFFFWIKLNYFIFRYHEKNVFILSKWTKSNYPQIICTTNLFCCLSRYIKPRHTLQPKWKRKKFNLHLIHCVILFFSVANRPYWGQCSLSTTRQQKCTFKRERRKGKRKLNQSASQSAN